MERIGKTIRLTLIELGHPQIPTQMQTENSTSMYMRYFCLIYQVYQRIFEEQWAPGLENIGY